MFGFFSDHFLFFGLEISYYGFIIACAMALAVFVACLNAKYRGLKTDDLVVAACYVLPLAIIGARLYYVIFSDYDYSFGEIFRIWDGGMAIYGGVIGGAIGVLLYCLIHKKNFLDVGDIAAPSLILGQAIGRIGCYFAGCCYGIEVTDDSLMWFPISTKIDGVWHYSTFFYESLWNLIGFAILMLLLRKSSLKQRGAIMSLYLIIYGCGRAWIESIRGDSLYLGSIKVSQLLSILLIIVGLTVLVTIYILHKKGKIKNVQEMNFPKFVAEYNAKVAKKKEESRLKRQQRREERLKNKAQKEDVKKSEMNHEEPLTKDNQIKDATDQSKEGQSNSIKKDNKENNNKNN